MDQHVYEQSYIYPFVTALSNFFQIIGIPLLFVVIVIWCYKNRTKFSYISVLGITLILASHLVRTFVPEVFSVVLSGLQPAEGQNVLIHFLYLHGANFGYIILSTGLLFSPNEKNL